MEKWKDILGYEGLYQASNYGRIKSLEKFVESVSHGKPCMRHIRECILQLQSHPNDYLQVNLNVDGKSKTFRVHTLIWEAFNGEIPEGMEIDHINAVRSDNRLENLRIMTHQENLNNPLTVIKRSNARKGMFKGEKNPMYGRKRPDTVTLLSKRVDQIDKITGEILHQWKSTMECERNGFTSGSVSECCNGKLQTHRGCKWKYVS